MPSRFGEQDEEREWQENGAARALAGIEAQEELMPIELLALVNGMERLTNGNLLGLYDVELKAIEAARLRLGRVEQEIMRRIREAGAMGIPDDVFDCVVETRYEYDQGRLQPLLEVLSTAELSAAYTPAHEEVREIVGTFDVRKLLPIARLHGDSVLGIVEEAKFVAGQKLRFKKKE